MNHSRKILIEYFYQVCVVAGVQGVQLCSGSRGGIVGRTPLNEKLVVSNVLATFAYIYQKNKISRISIITIN